VKILSAKVADLGDVLLTTPALQDLRDDTGLPPDVLIATHTTETLRGAPFVGRLWTTDRMTHLDPLKWRDPSRRSADLAALVALRRMRYDALALFHHLTTWRGAARWSMLSAVLGIPLRVGLDNGKGRFLSEPLADPGFGARHEVDGWRAVAARVIGRRQNTLAKPAPLWLPASLDDLRWAHDWRRATLDDAPFVAIHPGAGAWIPARQWPVEHFAELVARIRQGGFRVVILGSAREQHLATACGAGEREGVVNAAGYTTIGQMAALIALAAGFAGNDSFPMHLAAAANRPLVAIFGPTNVAAWGPWPIATPWFRVARYQTWCQPCSYTGHTLGRRFGCATRPCLGHISPSMVWTLLQEAIARHADSLTISATLPIMPDEQLPRKTHA
jgi:heptosyltransferase-2